jgi:hypothetical protein
MQQNYDLGRMIGQVLDRQKSIEDRLINLENELHTNQTFTTEKDFIEVLKYISKFFEGFQNILIFLIISGQSKKSRRNYSMIVFTQSRATSKWRQNCILIENTRISTTVYHVNVGFRTIKRIYNRR